MKRAAVRTRTPGISGAVRDAIEAMVRGVAKTITDAAAATGISREHLSRELSKPHVADHLRTKVMRALAVAAARAGHVKTALLDSPSEIVRDRASSYVLGLAGIAPASQPSVSVNVEIRAGYVIDLRDDDPPPTTINAVAIASRP